MDHESLKKGSGHCPDSGLPGGGALIYLAGHRTTHLAPFARIDRIRNGARPLTYRPRSGGSTYVVGYGPHRIGDFQEPRLRARELDVVDDTFPLQRREALELSDDATVVVAALRRGHEPAHLGERLLVVTDVTAWDRDAIRLSHVIAPRRAEA
ncbi:MAG: sortase domain-bontaining protein [Gaiellaceae bacterium]